MEKLLKAYILTAAAIGLGLGCQSVGVDRIRPESLILPQGARILICEAVRDVFRYEIRPFREEVDIPGVEVLGPPEGDVKGVSLDQAVKDMLLKRPAAMVLAVTPATTVERRYNPYRVFRGWRKITARDGTRDGRPVYQTREEPVFETQYEHKCARTTYRLYQYGKDGELLGTLQVAKTPVEACPQTTDGDVSFDDMEYLISWLKRHISVP